MGENKNVFYITITLGFLVFIIMLLVVFFTTSSNKKPAAIVKDTTQSVVETKYKGSFELKSDKAEYKTGEKITVKVFGNSDSQNVMGYDVVIEYDATKLKYMANKVLDKDFTTIEKNNKGVLKMIGYKTVDGSKIFNATEMLNLDFASISAGSSDLKVMFAKGQTTESNLMNETNEDVLTGVSNLSILVK